MEWKRLNFEERERLIVGSKFSPFKDLGNFHERRYRWEKSLEIFAGGMVEKIGGNKEREEGRREDLAGN